MANLPSGYTELEYIESTGTQYIDTGVEISEKTGLSFDYQQNNDTVGCICGCDLDWLSSGIIIVNNIISFGSSSSNSNLGLNDGIKHNISLTNAVFKKDEEIIFTGDGNFNSNGISFCIFSLNRNGTMQEYSTIKIWFFKIYNDNILVRNYVPCKNSVGIVGFYDLVSGSFFGNSGTGSFIAGPEVAPPETPGSFFQSASVVLRWSPVDCDGYRLYKNGFLLEETTETLYIDDAVSDGQDIEYSITAYRGSAESEPQTIQVSVREGYTILTPVITSAFFQ